jgi:hypothetical protein
MKGHPAHVLATPYAVSRLVQKTHDLVEPLCGTETRWTGANDEDVDVAGLFVSLWWVREAWAVGGEGSHLFFCHCSLQ